MNYRHAFHAGGFGDVVKHAVLSVALARMILKPKPILLVDTHAGIGRYELAEAWPARTGEYLSGIVPVLAAATALPACLSPWLDMVGDLNREGEVRQYPGSPELLARLSRPVDRVVLSELHPVDAKTLAATWRHDRRVTVHAQDGWATLRASLPPRERRALVLIDPSYESRTELANLPVAIEQAHRRFSSAAFLVWYPIKSRPDVWRFHEALIATNIPDMHAAEVTLAGEDTNLALYGCGLILINPPWPLRDQLSGVLEPLQRILASHAKVGGAGRGGVRVTTLAPERAGKAVPTHVVAR